MVNLHLSTDVPARLEQLRVTTGWSWDEIAERLEISRAMVYHVKSGERRFSPKVVHRLERLEKQAAQQSKAANLIKRGLKGEDLVNALLENTGARTTLGVDDIDRGYLDLKLSYRRGAPPRGYPKNIRVVAPGNDRALQIHQAIQRERKLTPVVAPCLPEQRNVAELLELLTPASYWDVLQACMSLTFGIDWRRSVANRLGLVDYAE